MPKFLQCEDMKGAPIWIVIAHIVSITNAFHEENRNDDECYVTTIRTLGGHVYRNINASLEQIEAALEQDGVVLFD